MKPESEVRQRLQIWQTKLDEHTFGKPDTLAKLEEAATEARIRELEWILAD